MSRSAWVRISEQSNFFGPRGYWTIKPRFKFRIKLGKTELEKTNLKKEESGPQRKPLLLPFSTLTYLLRILDCSVLSYDNS